MGIYFSMVNQLETVVMFEVIGLEIHGKNRATRYPKRLGTPNKKNAAWKTILSFLRNAPSSGFFRAIHVRGGAS